MEAKLLIDDVDLSSKWDALGSRITNVLSQRIDTATIFIEDDDDSLDIEELAPVVISNAAGDERYFSGYIGTSDPEIEGVKKLYRFDCRDNSGKLDRKKIYEVYEDKTSRAILQHAFQKYKPEIRTAPAIQFANGTACTVNCGTDHSLDFDASEKYTWAFWLYIDTLPSVIGKAGLVINKGTTSSGYRISIGSNDKIAFTSYQAGPSHNEVSSDTTLKAKRWYRVVITYDNGLVEIYVNAALDKSDTLAGTPVDDTTSAFKWGAGGATYTLSGKLADGRLYSRKLNNVEIGRLYRGGSVDDTDLELWTMFDEGTGSTAEDDSGNDNDGTITGATWALVDYVEEGLTIERLECKGWDLMRLVKWLADYNGFSWYIDYWENLRFFADQTEEAPFSIDRDNPDGVNSFGANITRYRKNGNRIVNRVLVRGGSYRSSDTEYERSGDGNTTDFALPYPMHAPEGETALLVYKNTGTDEAPVWTAQTVGADYINSLDDYDVLHNYQEKILKFASAPSKLDKGWKFEGQYDVPISQWVPSQSSYDRYGEWYEDELVDDTITLVEMSILRGQAYLAETAFSKEQGAFLIDGQDGLRSGMKIYIKDSQRGIDDWYHIQKVETGFLGTGVAQYKVDFGEYNPDVIDMLIQVKKASDPKIPMGSTEKMNEMFNPEEWVALWDSAEISSHATEDYNWGPDDDELVWSFSTWQ